MHLVETELEGVIIVEPTVHGDARGALFELWNQGRHEASGLLGSCVLDLISISRRGVVRGLHYQYPLPQAKLVTVLEGEVFDVALDVRRGSRTFGKWTSVSLSAENHRQLFIPRGFAHGFAVVSERAVMHYKLDERYSPEHGVGIVWNDPDLGIPWPSDASVVSAADAKLPRLRDAAVLPALG